MSCRYNHPEPARTKLALLLMKETRPQRQLAEELSIPPARLSEYSNGRKHIPAHHSRILALYFHTTIEEVIGIVEDDDFVELD